MTVLSDITTWIIIITGILVIWTLLFATIGWALKRILTYFKIYGLFFRFMLDYWKKKKKEAEDNGE